MNIIRWIAFIPLGIIAGAIAHVIVAGGYDLLSVIDPFGVPKWIKWSMAGLISAYVHVVASFYIAPRVTKFCKWFTFGIVVLNGLSGVVLVHFSNSVEMIEIFSPIGTLIAAFSFSGAPVEALQIHRSHHN